MIYDVIVVGAGLAGLVAVSELTGAGKKVLLLDQEPEASLGGQAWWSFGGLFLVDSPEQRRMGIKDSRDLAWQDWLGAAGYDREDDEDYWGKKWAESYVDFAAGENDNGYTLWGFASFQWSAGLSVEVIQQKAMVTLYPAFILCGERVPEL